MFSSKKTASSLAPVTDKSVIGTIIGKGISMEGGFLTGDGNVRIDGRFIGDIDVHGHIVISESGYVQGDINTHSALLAGEFSGNISAVEGVHLTATAVVTGNVASKSIVMDEDAAFNGNCKMKCASSNQNEDAGFPPVFALPAVNEG